MKVQATKVIAKEIAKYIESVCKHAHEVSVTTLSPEYYEFQTGCSPWENECDYDYRTGKMKVICVCRPAEYYAPAVYITTEMLVKSFRRLSEKTLQALMQQVWHDYIEC